MPARKKTEEESAVSALLGLIKNKTLAQVLGALLVLVPSYAHNVYTFGVDEGWWGKKVGVTEEGTALLTRYYFSQDYEEQNFDLGPGDSVNVRIYPSGDMWIKRTVDNGGARPYVTRRWFTKRKFEVVVAELKEWSEQNEASLFSSNAYAAPAPMTGGKCTEEIISEDEHFMYIKLVCGDQCFIIQLDKYTGEEVGHTACE
jgi:hypothetical protein